MAETNPFQTPQTEASIAESRQYERIRGWLVLLAVWLIPGIVISFAVLVAVILATLRRPSEMPRLDDPVLFQVMLFRAIVGAVAGPVAFALLLRRSKRFPMFLLVFWTLNLLLHMAAAFLIWSDHLPHYPATSDVTLWRSLLVITVVALALGIWIPYCFFAERARRTFVR